MEMIAVTATAQGADRVARDGGLGVAVDAVTRRLSRWPGPVMDDVGGSVLARGRERE